MLIDPKCVLRRSLECLTTEVTALSEHGIVLLPRMVHVLSDVQVKTEQFNILKTRA